MSAVETTVDPTVVDQALDSGTNLYILPELLIPSEANQRARPAETPEHRKVRVEKMASMIKSNRQLQPVLVVEVKDEEDGSVHYEYVDGGSRVDAIALLNETASKPIKVWCSVVSVADDHFRTAVMSNLGREGYSMLELAALIREVGEANGWQGRGANKKIANYLGLNESRVFELQKIESKVTPLVKDMINEGVIAHVDIALKLAGMPDEKVDAIAGRSYEIASERYKNERAEIEKEKAAKLEAEIAKSNAAKGGKAENKDATTAATETKEETPVVRAGDLRQAAAEQGESAGPLSKKDLLDFFAEKCGPAYSDEVKSFCEYFCDTYAKGNGTERTVNKLFDAMTYQTKESKAENKAKAKEAAEAAKLEAKKAAEKAKAKGPQKKDKDKDKK